MQCQICGTLLSDGTTKCPSCGTIMQPNESKSPYELEDEAIPFIDYPGRKAASALQPAPTAYGASHSSALPATARSDTPISPQPGVVPQQSAEHRPQTRRSISAGLAAIVVVLAFLLVGGGGFGYYLTKVQPSELNTQATSVVQHILTAQAQSSAEAKSAALAAFTSKSPQDIYNQITSRTPALSDLMNTQDTNTWINYNGPIQSCIFIGGAYHVLSSRGFPLCLAENTDFTNFAYQARMTLLHGDRGSLLFRVDDLNYTFYRFNISRDGSYSLRVLHNNAPQDMVLFAGFSSIISANTNRPDPVAITVTVVAFDSYIYLYVNGQFLAQVIDHTTSSGKIGVSAVRESNPTEVVFSDVKVWTL
jgi:hypothetical protein